MNLLFDLVAIAYLLGACTGSSTGTKQGSQTDPDTTDPVAADSAVINDVAVDAVVSNEEGSITLPGGALLEIFAGSELRMSRITTGPITDVEVVTLGGTKVELNDRNGNPLPAEALLQDLVFEGHITQAQWDELSESERQLIMIIIEGNGELLEIPIENAAADATFSVSIPKAMVTGTGGASIYLVASGSNKTESPIADDEDGDQVGPNDSNTQTPPSTLDTTAPLVPTFSPASGTIFGSDLAFTIQQNSTPASDFKEFRYTTNGIAPSNCNDGTASSGAVALSISADVTIKAIACDETGNASAVATVSFTYDGTAPASPTISISSGAAYSTSNTVVLSLGATDAIQMYITNVSGCASGGAWETYATSKVGWSLAASNQTTSVYVKYRDAVGNETACVSDAIIHDNTNPNPPTSFSYNANHTSTNTSPSLTWVAGSDSGSGISHYEIAIGTTQGDTDIYDWTSVGNVTSAQISSLTLTDGHTYYASVRAVDNAELISTVTEGSGWTVNLPIDCSGLSGGEWVGVPANSDVGQAVEFCVMKYEAKLSIGGVVQPDGDFPTNEIALSSVYLDGIVVKRDSDNVIIAPVSSPQGNPWVYARREAISGDDAGATELCASLGTGYTLMSNAQWQTIARNIEANPYNWNSGLGPVGTGTMPRGNSNSSGSSGAPADVTGDPDDDPYVNTGYTADWTHKRTHVLSNNEVIWDIAGNVWEWVSDDVTGTSLTPSLTTGWNEFSNASFFPASPGDNRLKLAPLGSYNSGQFVGQGYGGSGGALFRGAHWASNTYAGVFAWYLNMGPTYSNNNVGFRCVWQEAN